MLKNCSDEQLISKLKNLVRDEKALTLTILHHLREVEARQLELSRGHASLYKFCLHELGYSEAEALIRIRAMRLLKSLPEVEQKIQSGELSLTNAAEIQNQIRRENDRRKKASLRSLTAEDKKEVLELARNTSTRACQRSLAIVFPEIQNEPKEQIRVTRDSRMLIQFSANQELMDKLEKLKGLLAHKDYAGSYEQLFLELANLALEKLDPTQRKTNRSLPVEKLQDGKLQDGKLKKPEFSQQNLLEIELQPQNQLSQSKPLDPKKPNAGLPCAPEAPAADIKSSRYISAPLRRKIWKKAEGRCEFHSPQTGLRCDSRHALEIDHIHEFARGGKSEEQNLRLLCDAHNRSRHFINSRARID